MAVQPHAASGSRWNGFTAQTRCAAEPLPTCPRSNPHLFWERATHSSQARLRPRLHWMPATKLITNSPFLISELLAFSSSYWTPPFPKLPRFLCATTLPGYCLLLSEAQASRFFFTLRPSACPIMKGRSSQENEANAPNKQTRVPGSHFKESSNCLVRFTKQICEDVAYEIRPTNSKALCNKVLLTIQCFGLVCKRNKSQG